MYDNQRQAQPWIYAAAIMDSDGCFMITRYNRTNGYFYLPMVKITMVDDGAINYIQKEVGLGSVTIVGTRPSRPNSRPLFQWTITNREDLQRFLTGIMPYLRNKEDRAQHLLNYCNTTPCLKNASRNHKLSDDELLYREESYQRMRELNGKNAAATTKSQGPEKGCDSLIS